MVHCVCYFHHVFVAEAKNGAQQPLCVFKKRSYHILLRIHTPTSPTTPCSTCTLFAMGVSFGVFDVYVIYHPDRNEYIMEHLNLN